MKKHIYTADGATLLKTVEAEPVCGEDFCDRCGDCLACYGGDECYDGEWLPSHFWVEYSEAQRDS